MSIAVTLVGILAIGIAVVMAAAPQRFIGWMRSLDPRRRFGLAVGVRVALGATFLLAAPSCRLPSVVATVGVIALVAAVAILLMGQQRLDTLIAWWLGRPTGLMRSVSLLAAGFGVLLIYAGA